MRVVISLRYFQRSIVLKFGQSRGLELGSNELLIILELVLRVREALLEQPDLPMRLGETDRRVQVRLCVVLRGAGGLLVRVGPIVGLQL